MKIAAVHTYSLPGELDKNISETRKTISLLEADSPDFVLFPELNISGYIKSRELLEEVVIQKSNVMDQLLDISANTTMAISVGFPEKECNQYYISQHLFQNGKLVGRHRKTHLGPTEKETYSEADNLDVFELKNLNVGIQLCFETHFPEISYAQSKQGADILAMGFASPRETSAEKAERLKRYLCARAYDNSCYVIACNMAGKSESGREFDGLSMIIDPKGNVLCESQSNETGYCIAEFEKQKIMQIKESRMGWFNEYKRKDIMANIYN